MFTFYKKLRLLFSKIYTDAGNIIIPTDESVCISLENMNTTSEDYRDWSSPPSDVVSSIANVLPLSHRVLMRKVCSSWRFAIPVERLPSPWLILPGVGDDIESRTSCKFFSVAANRSIGSGSLPVLNGKRCVGSNAGWVVMADDYCLDFKVWNNRNNFSRHTVNSLDPITLNHRCHDVYLQPQEPCMYMPQKWIVKGEFNTKLCVLNPLTGVMFPLPSFETHASMIRTAVNRADVRDRLDYMYTYNCSNRPFYFYVYKILVSLKTLTHDFVALAMYSKWAYLAYTRAGDDQWTFFDIGVSYYDIIYHNGKFYGLTHQYGQVRVFDFTNVGRQSPPCIKVVFPSEPAGGILHRRDFMRFTWQNLVFSITGELLLILRGMNFIVVSDNKKKFITSKFIVMRYNPYNSEMNQVKDLKGQALFIGNNNAFSISCKDVSGIKNNCIYFTDSLLAANSQTIQAWQSDVGVFNLERQSIESCAPPNTRLNWPPPVWLQPHSKLCRNTGGLV